ISAAMQGNKVSQVPMGRSRRHSRAYGRHDFGSQRSTQSVKTMSLRSGEEVCCALTIMTTRWIGVGGGNDGRRMRGAPPWQRSDVLFDQLAQDGDAGADLVLGDRDEAQAQG